MHNRRKRGSHRRQCAARRRRRRRHGRHASPARQSHRDRRLGQRARRAQRRQPGGVSQRLRAVRGGDRHLDRVRGHVRPARRPADATRRRQPARHRVQPERRADADAGRRRRIARPRRHRRRRRRRGRLPGVARRAVDGRRQPLRHPRDDGGRRPRLVQPDAVRRADRRHARRPRRLDDRSRSRRGPHAVLHRTRVRSRERLAGCLVHPAVHAPAVRRRRLQPVVAGRAGVDLSGGAPGVRVVRRLSPPTTPGRRRTDGGADHQLRHSRGRPVRRPAVVLPARPRRLARQRDGGDGARHRADHRRRLLPVPRRQRRRRARHRHVRGDVRGVHRHAPDAGVPAVRRQPAVQRADRRHRSVDRAKPPDAARRVHARSCRARRPRPISTPRRSSSAPRTACRRRCRRPSTRR